MVFSGNINFIKKNDLIVYLSSYQKRLIKKQLILKSRWLKMIAKQKIIEVMDIQVSNLQRVSFCSPFFPRNLVSQLNVEYFVGVFFLDLLKSSEK